MILPKIDTDGTAGYIFSALAAVFFVLCFLFSLYAAAVRSASLGGIKNEEENDSKKTKTAVRIKTSVERYFCGLCAGAVFNGTGFVFAVSCLFFLYSAALSNVGTAAAAVITLFLTVMLLSAGGVIIPMKLSVNDPDKLLIKHGRLIMLMSALFFPVGALCSLASMIFGIFMTDSEDDNENENPTEEKILAIADEGEENGTIEENTRSMIENVFDFDDTSVGEIMTHRKDIVAVREDDSLKKLTALAIESGRSRIPVYHEDIDNIIGIIYVKDLLQYVGRGEVNEKIDPKMIHESVFVPESKRCSEMFEYMTAHKTQIAVVVDEFGGTGGIITMEDLVESILGNIQDEYDNEDETIKKVNENSFTVDGATPLDEIEDLTGISFEGDPNDTLAGIMLDRMGHIPKNGEHPSIMINGTRFTVLESDQRRISKILIVKNKHNTDE